MSSSVACVRGAPTVEYVKSPGVTCATVCGAVVSLPSAVVSSGSVETSSSITSVGSVEASRAPSLPQTRRRATVGSVNTSAWVAISNVFLSNVMWSWRVSTIAASATVVFA